MITVLEIAAAAYGLYCVAFWASALWACWHERWCPPPCARPLTRAEVAAVLPREIELRPVLLSNERRYVRTVARTPRAVFARLAQTSPRRTSGAPPLPGLGPCEPV